MTEHKFNLPRERKDTLKTLINFVVSCLQDEDGESIGVHDHLGDVAEWAEITLKEIGYTEEDVARIIEDNRYKEDTDE